jgi:hypothetical protein
VISDSLSVTERFQDGIGLQYLKLESSIIIPATICDGGQVLNDLFGVFSLTSTRFTAKFLLERKYISRNQDGLIFLVCEHIVISAIRDRIDVRSHLSSLLALVATDNLVRVDWEFFVGINSNQKEARIGLECVNFTCHTYMRSE